MNGEQGRFREEGALDAVHMLQVAREALLAGEYSLSGHFPAHVSIIAEEIATDLEAHRQPDWLNLRNDLRVPCANAVTRLVQRHRSYEEGKKKVYVFAEEDILASRALSVVMAHRITDAADLQLYHPVRQLIYHDADYWATFFRTYNDQLSPGVLRNLGKGQPADPYRAANRVVERKYQARKQKMEGETVDQGTIYEQAKEICPIITPNMAFGRGSANALKIAHRMQNISQQFAEDAFTPSVIYQLASTYPNDYLPRAERFREAVATLKRKYGEHEDFSDILIARLALGHFETAPKEAQNYLDRITKLHEQCMQQGLTRIANSRTFLRYLARDNKDPKPETLSRLWEIFHLRASFGATPVTRWMVELIHDLHPDAPFFDLHFRTANLAELLKCGVMQQDVLQPKYIRQKKAEGTLEYWQSKTGRCVRFSDTVKGMLSLQERLALAGYFQLDRLIYGEDQTVHLAYLFGDRKKVNSFVQKTILPKVNEALTGLRELPSAKTVARWAISYMAEDALDTRTRRLYGRYRRDKTFDWATPTIALAVQDRYPEDAVRMLPDNPYEALAVLRWANRQNILPHSSRSPLISACTEWLFALDPLTGGSTENLSREERDEVLSRAGRMMGAWGELNEINTEKYDLNLWYGIASCLLTDAIRVKMRLHIKEDKSALLAAKIASTWSPDAVRAFRSHNEKNGVSLAVFRRFLAGHKGEDIHKVTEVINGKVSLGDN